MSEMVAARDWLTVFQHFPTGDPDKAVGVAYHDVIRPSRGVEEESG